MQILRPPESESLGVSLLMQGLTNLEVFQYARDWGLGLSSFALLSLLLHSYILAINITRITTVLFILEN